MASNIYIRGVVCADTQEARDEVLLRFYADDAEHDYQKESWGPANMDDGDARNINYHIPFDKQIEIQAWEMDRGRSNKIGDSLIIRDTNRSISEVRHRFQGRGAKYDLVYALNPSHNKEFYLHLEYLKCNDAQEARDETYIVVNGQTVYGPYSMRTGKTRDIHIDPINFSGSGAAIIEIWERDGSKSDRIGRLRIDERLARVYAANSDKVQTQVFHADRHFPGDATYTLGFKISSSTQSDTCAPIR